MKIFAQCMKCNAELQSSTLYDTRLEYVMKKGEYIEQRCRVCNTDNRIIIDEYITRESKSMKTLALTLLIVGLLISSGIFLWLLEEKQVIVVAYGMFGVPFFVYGILLQYDKKRVSSFNNLYVKR